MALKIEIDVLKRQELNAFYDNGLNLGDNCNSETKPIHRNFIVNQWISLAIQDKEGFLPGT